LSDIPEMSAGRFANGGTSPGNDPVSFGGLAAGGCNWIAFTAGRGSAIGSRPSR
jgi:altronate dehydratase